MKALSDKLLPMKIASIYSAESLKKTPLPLFTTNVSAGFPSPAEDHIEQKLDLNEHLIAHPAATFFVKVEGESMIDAGIRSGDLLIVDRALPAQDGKVVVAVLEGEFTVKRLKVSGKHVTLYPENPKYPPVPIGPETNFQVWGVVTYVIHPL